MATHFFNFKLHSAHNEINLANVDKKRYKYGNLLIFACFFLFTSSMAAKGIFASQMKFMADLWNLEYAKVSLANTYYFVSYGLVQIGLFLFMQKISMRKYLIWTVPVAAITTALIGAATKIEHVWIYFGISGAFQAGLYAGCNLILTRYLPLKQLSKANKIMNFGYAGGSVVAYLLSALFIGIGGEAWRVPYFIIGGIFLLSVIVFGVIIVVSRRFAKINGLLDKKITEEIKNVKANAMNDDDPFITIENKKKLIVFYVIDLIMAFIITALYYCVMNYIPSLLVDVHGLPQDTSIYVSIIAPIAIALGPLMTINSCDHHKDFIRQGLLYTLLLLPVSLLLVFFHGTNIFLALALLIIFIVVANGVKAIVLSVITFKLRKVMNAGAYSAISNAIASLAAGVTPTIIGGIIDTSGWATSYLVTFGLCAVVAVALFVIDIFVRREYKKAHGMKANEKLD